MDGSVVEYKITHDADDYGTPNKLTRDDILDLIRDAGFRPVERNTRYEIIREYAGPDAAGGSRRSRCGCEPAARSAARCGATAGLGRA